MRDQKVWSLPKFAYRWVGHEILQTALLHASGHKQSWANKSPDQFKLQTQPYTYMWSCESVFWLQKDKLLPNPKWARLRGYPASVVGLAGHLELCFLSLYHTCSGKINMNRRSGQSIHLIPFALSVLIDKPSPVRKGVSVQSFMSETSIVRPKMKRIESRT